MFVDVLCSRLSDDMSSTMILSHIDRAIRTSQTMLSGLRDTALLEGGLVEPLVRAFDVGELLRELHCEARPLADQKGIRLRLFDVDGVNRRPKLGNYILDYASCHSHISVRENGTMAQSAPGKHYREGISLVELFGMFPDNAAAERWFEERRWGAAGNPFVLPHVWFDREATASPLGQTASLLVRRVSAQFQRQDRHRDAPLQDWPPENGPSRSICGLHRSRACRR